MKNRYTLLFFAVLLCSCSFVAQASPTVAPTLTSSPTVVPTLTPTVPTPTFTDTPTLVALNTKTSTPDFTSTPTTLMDTASPTMTALVIVPTVSTPGFVKISLSATEFYKGKKCLPGSVKFSVQVADPKKTAFVVLFVRFKSKLTGSTSKWTSITMQPLGIIGTFSSEIFPDLMKGVDSFENAWVQYQLVATDADSLEIGHTDIFNDRLTLLECVSTATPTVSPSPSPFPSSTATARKP